MVQEILEKIKKTKVLVVGDLMLDRYWQGEVERISPEAPVPIVGINREHIRELPGGAANVARNVTALGAECTLLGITGDDPDAKTLKKKLEQEDRVKCDFVTDETIQTIVKLRIISQNQQLIRLDFESPITRKHSQRLEEKMQEYLPAHDAVVFSDYGKGSLTRISSMIANAKKSKKPAIVDPKGDDYSIYRNATMITPNRKEFERVAGRFKNDGELIEKANRMIKELCFESILVTRGSEGMNWIDPDDLPGSRLHGTRAREVYDVTGAGDTVIATIGAGVAAKIDRDDLIHLALYTSGIVVAKLGSATATVEDVIQAYKNDEV
jgi:D-glycero-beta-D-manno-heptose-7-phosphate kinase